MRFRRPSGDDARGDEAAPSSLRDRFVRLAIGVVFLASLVVAVFGRGGFLDLQRSQDGTLEAQRELEARQARVDSLKAEIARLEGRAGLERLARERMDMARPGEVLFLLPSEPSKVRKQVVPKDGGSSSSAR